MRGLLHASSFNLQGTSEGAALGRFSAAERLSSVSLGSGSVKEGCWPARERATAAESSSLCPLCHQGSSGMSPGYTQEALLRAPGVRSTMARNTQSWTRKGWGGCWGWGCAEQVAVNTLGSVNHSFPVRASPSTQTRGIPGRSEHLGVWKPQIPCSSFSFHSTPGDPRLIIRNSQAPPGTLTWTLSLAKGQGTCQKRDLGTRG